MIDNKTFKRDTILIADSCSGALSLLKHFEKWAGDFQIAYLADYEKNPFGLKNQAEIIEIVKSWFTNLVLFDNVKLVVIACNTASIASYSILKDLSNEYHIPVISMVDGMIECIERNRSQVLNKNVAIMATKYTIESKKYFDVIKKHNPNKIAEIIGTQSEHAVATGSCNSSAGRKCIGKELIKYQRGKINTLVLSCTCFQLIVDQIKNVFGKDITFLDPSYDVSELSKRALNISNGKFGLELCIYTTSETPASLLGLKVSCLTIFKEKLSTTFLHLNR